jgi:uncharacterized membrane protein
MNIAGKTVSIGSILGAVGGLLAVLGAPLAWMTVSAGGQSTSVTGLDKDLNGGKVALVLGLLIIALVVATVLNVKIPMAGAVLAGLGVLVLVVIVLVYFTSILSTPSFKDAMDLVNGFGGNASLGIGVWLEILGAILAIVGGALNMSKKAA